MPVLFFVSPEAVAPQETFAGKACCEAGGVAVAQEDAPDERQLTLDLSLFGVALGYAKRTSPSRLVGGELALLGDWVNFTPFAGAHFSQAVAYQARDDYGGEALWEMLSAGMYVRYERSSRWQHEVGAHASLFAHYDDSDDDPGVGVFIGGSYTPTWGTRRFRLRPRVLAGVFWEPDVATEFGINISFLTGRVVFGW